MEDYNSKYTGEQVEALLGKADTALQEHQDISGKQDVISDLATIREGAAKGATALQSIPEEYVTDGELAAVAKSGSYNDLSNKPSIPTKTSDLTNDSGFLTEHQDISNLATKSELQGKQDTITDLATIREGAAKGATALQSIPAEYVTETELTNKGYATTSAMNTALGNKVDKVTGKQLTTEDFTTALKTKLEGLSNYDDSAIQEAVEGLQTQLNTLVSGDADAAIESFNEIIAFLDGVEDTETLEGIIASIERQIAGKQDAIDDLATIRSNAEKGASAVQPSSLATVATSGSYNDLSNKPTIPSAVTESTVSGWGFTKNTGTYSKPSTGIPKSDLASAVQTSLGKADTALQAEQYKGTVTGVKMNGSTKNPSNGVVDLGTVITSHQDISGKQDKLVSGTNIKTINGSSLLGSGNLVISGGGGGGSSAYSEVSHGTSDTTFTLTPNTFHVWDEVASLTLTLGDETAGVANEFLFQFLSGSTPTTLSLPDDLKWPDDEPLTPEADKMYQLSILKGAVSVLSWSNAPTLVDNLVSISVSNNKYLISLQYPAASDLEVRVRDSDGIVYANVPIGASSATATPMSPMIDTGAKIELVTPTDDDVYSYIW